jgi:hypothetical protein
VYSLPTAAAAAIHDRGPEQPTTWQSYVEPGETVTGFAYDPFTDHFFLRLAPGNRIRVVDRPARAIKREFDVPSLPSGGGGDLALRPRSGHLYFVHPVEAALVETTRLGEPVRSLRLRTRPEAVAFDMVRDRLLVLVSSSPARLEWHDLAGTALGSVTLNRAVGRSLGYDADRREIYATLPSGAVGVFDEEGCWQRTLEEPAEFVDVGQRSLLRMF